MNLFGIQVSNPFTRIATPTPLEGKGIERRIEIPPVPDLTPYKDLERQNPAIYEELLFRRNLLFIANLGKDKDGLVAEAPLELAGTINVDQQKMLSQKDVSGRSVDVGLSHVMGIYNKEIKKTYIVGRKRIDPQLSVPGMPMIENGETKRLQSPDS